VSGVCPPRDYESAVRFFAVLDGEDAEELSIGAEEEAVIAEPEAEFAGVLALQGFDVTLARNGKAIKAVENAHGGIAVERTDVSAGLVGPVDAKGHAT